MSEYSGQLLICAFTIGLLGSFQFFYHISVSNGVARPLINFLNETLNADFKSPNENGANGSDFDLTFSNNQITEFYGLYLASQMTGGIFGPSLGAFLADRFGRRPALISLSILILMSIMPASLSRYVDLFYLLIISKLLIGLCSMAAITVGSIYMSEISPVKIRGGLNLVIYMSQKIGALVGQCMAVPILLGTEERWPYIWHVQVVLAVVALLLVIPFCLESPHFLLQSKQTDRAKKVIQHFQGIDCKKTDEVMGTIEQELSLQRSSLSVWQAFRHPATRHGMRLSLMLGICNSSTGIDVLQSMTTLLFVRTGFSHSESANLAALLMFLVLIISIGATFGVEKFGRRPLVIGGAVAVGFTNLACFGTVMAYDVTKNIVFGYAFLGSMVLFFVAFTFGPGSLAWFMPTELVPVSGRAAAQCVCSTATCMLGVFITALFLVLQSRLGPAAFLFFSVPMWLFAIYFWKYLPETKNRPIGEIAEEQMTRNRKKSARTELKQDNTTCL